MVTSVFAPETYERPQFAAEGERRGYFSDLIRVAFPLKAGGRGRAVLLASPTSGSGVSFIASSVAAEISQSAGRVLLADAHALLCLASGEPEEATALSQRIEPGKLWVLGMRQAAAAPEGASESGSPRISRLLESLRDKFSHIVIDSPALSSAPDTLLLASAVEGVILVAQAGQTEKRQIVDAYRKITSLGGLVLGSVYNAQ